MCRFIGRILAEILFVPDVRGTGNVPEEGAFLLCSNHIHALDPIAVSVLIDREPRFMGKKELFESWFGKWLFGKLRAFPVDRSVSADMKSFRTAMNVLKNGHGLVIFSQGTRMKEFEGSKSGVALFALKSGAPIVPVGIVGTYRLFSKVSVRYGEPIYPDEFAGKRVSTEAVERVMEVVVERVSALCEPN